MSASGMSTGLETFVPLRVAAVLGAAGVGALAGMVRTAWRQEGR